MAISSSSGSNSFGDSSSSSSPSSSSLSASSIDSIPESREPTPEWDPTAAYKALAPLHWDAEEFDFGVVSEEEEPETEGEDLRLLFQEESESTSNNKFSWDGVDSSSEEEIDSTFVDDPMGGNPFRFLGSSEENSEEESSGGGRSSDFGSEGGSSAFDDDDSYDDSDDDGSDGGDVPARSPKLRRY